VRRGEGRDWKKLVQKMQKACADFSKAGGMG
jgi:hypothetical protein